MGEGKKLWHKRIGKWGLPVLSD